LTLEMPGSLVGHGTLSSVPQYTNTLQPAQGGPSSDGQEYVAEWPVYAIPNISLF
jgi:hypothetical protein